MRAALAQALFTEPDILLLVRLSSSKSFSCSLCFSFEKILKPTGQ